MNKIIKNTVILTLITLIAGICLGAVYEHRKRGSRRRISRYLKMRMLLKC